MNELTPLRFDEEFLDWFRARTEQAWARHRTADFTAARTGGLDWQTGTRWLDGLTDDQIDDVERRWSVCFPPDYRLFLRRMHSVDRPQVGALYVGDKLRPAERPSFYNWLTDVDTVREYIGWPLEGLLFDVENSDLWLPAWGERPDSRQGRAAVVRELVASAPCLIPIFSHRYLLAEPCRAGNPVFSVRQTDAIVYGADLRRYLLTELAELLGIERGPFHAEAADVSIDLASIPFWSAVWGG